MKGNMSCGFFLFYLFLLCPSISLWSVENEEKITVTASAVSAIPSAVNFKGVVKEYCLTSASLSGISPEQTLYKMVILVEAVEEVKGHPNFLKGREGQSVTFFSKEKLSPGLFKQKIKAIVEYRGDERGGNFWIKDIEIIEE